MEARSHKSINNCSARSNKAAQPGLESGPPVAALTSIPVQTHPARPSLHLPPNCSSRTTIQVNRRGLCGERPLRSSSLTADRLGHRNRQPASLRTALYTIFRPSSCPPFASLCRTRQLPNFYDASLPLLPSTWRFPEGRQNCFTANSPAFFVAISLPLALSLFALNLFFVMFFQPLPAAIFLSAYFDWFYALFVFTPSFSPFRMHPNVPPPHFFSLFGWL